MKSTTYRDMHLLNELSQRPDATQRELSRRIGVALGLTNLMLRRLVKKGYVKISGTKRNRIRYLITPQGILEKSRLTYEFIQYSLYLYRRIRDSLREQLVILAQTGHRKILLCGTGELTEIAFLTIREMGLEVVGVVDEAPDRERFLGYLVQKIDDAPTFDFDWMIVSTLRHGEESIRQFVAAGVLLDQMIILPRLGMQQGSLEGLSVAGISSSPSGTTRMIPAPATDSAGV